MSQSKIELVLSLKNRLGKGLKSAKDRLGGGIKDMKGKIHAFKESHIKAFSAMTDQVPMLGNALSLLTNPYALITAGVIALGAAAFKVGGHLVDVSQKVKTVQMDVRATTGLMGNQMRDTTADVVALSKSFDVGQREIIQSGNAMAKEFGISMKSATGLIEDALIATNGALDIDQLKEYSTQMKSAGLSAKETTKLVVNSFKDGIYQDKAIDSIKEANLRLREMPKATKDALGGLGINANALQKELNSGSISTMDAIRRVSASMAKVDKTARQSSIASIFGTPGEDAGEKFLLGLANAKNALGDIVDLQDPIVKRQKERLGLEKKISLTIQGFSDDVNHLKGDFDVLVLKGKLLFYQTIKKGFDLFKEYGMPLVEGLGRSIKNNVIPFVWALQRGWQSVVNGFTLANSALIGIRRLTGWIFDKLKEGVSWILEKTGTKSLMDSLFGNTKSIWSTVRSFFDDTMIRINAFTGLSKVAFSTVNHALRGNFGEAKKGYSDLKSQLTDIFSKDYVLRQKQALGLKPVEKKEDETDATADYVAPVKTPTNTDSADKVVEKSQVARNISINIDAFWKGDKINQHHTKSMSDEDFLAAFEESILMVLNNLTRSY